MLCCVRSSETEGGTVREVRNTQVSLVIAAVFLVSRSVRWIPNIWELRQAGDGVVRKYFRKYFNHFGSQKIFQPFCFTENISTTLVLRICIGPVGSSRPARCPTS